MSGVTPVVGGVYVSYLNRGKVCTVLSVSEDDVTLTTFDVFSSEEGYVSCSRELFEESWEPYILDGVHQINVETVDNSDGYGKLREAAGHLGLSEDLERIINLSKDLK